MQDIKPGLFIVLDGCDGAGKSVQLKALQACLERAGYDVVTTREPGGSPEAETIRDLLVNGDTDRWDKISEVLLFSAARRNHVETVIKPALAAGKIVLCDRFVPSTVAYQGYGHGVSRDIITMVTRLAIGDFQPDLTFLFFIDSKLGLRRAAERRGTETRFESFGAAFHERVYEGYASFLIDNDHRPLRRYVPIAVTEDRGITREQSINDITARLLTVTMQYLAIHGL